MEQATTQQTWEELNYDEKIENLARVIEHLSERIQYLESSNSDLRRDLLNHEHGENGPFRRVELGRREGDEIAYDTEPSLRGSGVAGNILNRRARR